MAIELIGLDADDTLWHNETIFRSVQGRFAALLAEFADVSEVEAQMEAIERRNLDVYGYGAKGFTLSMIEIALDVSAGRVRGDVLAEVLAIGKGMMLHPIEPLPGVEEAVERLAEQARLVLITKGDLFHQEAKLAASGLGRFFSGVEIVSEKAPDTYRRILGRYGVAAEGFVMAGNSVRSDILPVLTIGGRAALVPYPLVWSHEAAEPPQEDGRFRQLGTLAELPDWIETLAAEGNAPAEGHQRR